MNARLSGGIVCLSMTLSLLVAVLGWGCAGGGSAQRLQFRVTLDRTAGDAGGAVAAAECDAVRDVLLARVRALGVRAPRVQPLGPDSFVLAFPVTDTPDVGGLLALLRAGGCLEFRLVHGDSVRLAEAAAADPASAAPPGYTTAVLTVLRDGRAEKETLFLSVAAEALTERDVHSAVATVNDFRGHAVSIALGPEGTRRFAEITAAGVGRRLAILVDGQVLMAPVVREPILGGRLEIVGGFTLAQARELAAVLSAGRLPVPVRVELLAAEEQPAAR